MAAAAAAAAAAHRPMLATVTVPRIADGHGAMLAEGRVIASLKIVSWNLLAQCLVRRELYPYITDRSATNPLGQKARLPLLIDVLLARDGLAPAGADASNGSVHPAPSAPLADIFCLQEVDAKNWDDKIYPALTAAGYDAVFRAKGARNPGGSARHGLAIAWLRDRLAPAAPARHVTFDSHPLSTPTAVSPVTTNAALLVALRLVRPSDTSLHSSAAEPQPQPPTDSGLGVLVATHHLYWRPTANYERLRQTRIVLTELQTLAADLGVLDWPAFLAG
ncbi:hypothetical protein HK405_002660, partial [Cladochytrium tenue]